MSHTRSIGAVVIGLAALSSAPALRAAETGRGGRTAAAPKADVQVQSLEGSPVRLADQLAGRPTLLVFWASWCPACRQELPRAEEAHARFAARGLNVVGVNLGIRETVADVRSYLSNSGLTFPMFYDAGQVAMKSYRVTATPAVLLLDRQGEVVARSHSVDSGAIEAALSGETGSGAS
jgi:thiol-disulfide isomerase/thioredoxin